MALLLLWQGAGCLFRALVSGPYQEMSGAPIHNHACFVCVHCLTACCKELFVLNRACQLRTQRIQRFQIRHTHMGNVKPKDNVKGQKTKWNATRCLYEAIQLGHTGTHIPVTTRHIPAPNHRCVAAHTEVTIEESTCHAQATLPALSLCTANSSCVSVKSHASHVSARTPLSDVEQGHSCRPLCTQRCIPHLPKLAAHVKSYHAFCSNGLPRDCQSAALSTQYGLDIR